MGAPRTREGRVIPALVLALVWAAGFEVLPFVHALEHASPTGSRHCHDGTCHDDDPASAGIGASDHGAHSLAHRDVAALTPGPVVLRFPVVVVAEVDAPSVLPSLRPAPAPSHPSARGPPRS